MSRRIKFGVFTFLLSAVLVTCGVMIDGELLSRQKEKEVFEELAKLVTVEKSTASPAPTGSPPADKQPGPAATPSPDSQESQEQRRDLSELFAMNEDFVGWLCIPDTDINYRSCTLRAILKSICAGIFRASIANPVFLFWISDAALTATTSSFTDTT